MVFADLTLSCEHGLTPDELERVAAGELKKTWGELSPIRMCDGADCKDGPHGLVYSREWAAKVLGFTKGKLC